MRRLARFETRKAKLVRDDMILRGEPVFPGTRLAVRRVGGLLLKGVSIAELKDDYAYLTAEDIEFAKDFTVAFDASVAP